MLRQLVLESERIFGGKRQVVGRRMVNAQIRQDSRTLSAARVRGGGLSVECSAWGDGKTLRTPVLVTECTFGSGSDTLTLNTEGVTVPNNALVSGDGIPEGTRVVSSTGTVVTISKRTTKAKTTATIKFTLGGADVDTFGCHFFKCWKQQVQHFPEVPIALYTDREDLRRKKDAASLFSSYGKKDVPDRELTISNGKRIGGGTYGAVFRGVIGVPKGWGRKYSKTTGKGVYFWKETKTKWTPPLNSTTVCVKIGFGPKPRKESNAAASRRQARRAQNMVMEALMQVHLRCLLEDSPERKEMLLRQAPYAKIPRIYQLVRTKKHDPTKIRRPTVNTPGVFGVAPTNLIVMECLEGTLRSLLKNKKIGNKREIVREAFRQLARTLSVLQSRFKFEHRDMHAGNIMYRKDTDNKYQFYLIDFGMSIVEYERTWYFNKVNRAEGSADRGWDTSETLGFVNKKSCFGGDFAQLALDMREVLQQKKQWDDVWAQESWAVALLAVDKEKKTIEQGKAAHKYTYTYKNKGKGTDPAFYIAYGDRFYYKSFEAFEPAKIPLGPAAAPPAAAPPAAAPPTGIINASLHPSEEIGDKTNILVRRQLPSGSVVEQRCDIIKSARTEE